MSERGHEIYCRVVRVFDKALYEELKWESDETKDYVEQRILDEYRPWNYMNRHFKEE